MLLQGKDFHHLLQPLFEGEEAQNFRKKVEEKIAQEFLDKVFQTWFEEQLKPADTSAEVPDVKQEVPKARLSSKASVTTVPNEHSQYTLRYAEVLRLLREAERSGTWPACSKGREKVIKASEGEHGSFTVGSMPPSMEAPNGNRLFPELAMRCFELERILKPGRCSSTIAINKRAQFLPHIDSGAGAGQGISLIVGLGDYSGGELCVENDSHDIRYKPLEFNGWTQRHWTKPFQGDRFSLVWFTPAGCENCPGLEMFQKILQAGSSRLSSRILLFDTASIYKNEAAVGRALEGKNEGVFVTSKCSPYEMGFDKAQEACRKSLERLGRNKLDLYLIHWPGVPKKPHTSPLHRRARHETWKAMEELYRQHLVRAIGVREASHLFWSVVLIARSYILYTSQLRPSNSVASMASLSRPIRRWVEAAPATGPERQMVKSMVPGCC
eukprot:g27024.t1